MTCPDANLGTCKLSNKLWKNIINNTNKLAVYSLHSFTHQPTGAQRPIMATCHLNHKMSCISDAAGKVMPRSDFY